MDPITEAQIQEAIDRGGLHGLPGEGQPLRLEDGSGDIDSRWPACGIGSPSSSTKRTVCSRNSFV